MAHGSSPEILEQMREREREGGFHDMVSVKRRLIGTNVTFY